MPRRVGPAWSTDPTISPFMVTVGQELSPHAPLPTIMGRSLSYPLRVLRNLPTWTPRSLAPGVVSQTMSKGHKYTRAMRFATLLPLDNRVVFEAGQKFTFEALDSAENNIPPSLFKLGKPPSSASSIPSIVLVLLILITPRAVTTYYSSLALC